MFKKEKKGILKASIKNILISSYKPTGNLIYNQLFKSIQDKTK